jgi:hypothetical protein
MNNLDTVESMKSRKCHVVSVETRYYETISDDLEECHYGIGVSYSLAIGMKVNITKSTADYIYGYEKSSRLN